MTPRAIRLFVDTPLAADEGIVLDDKAAHYVRTVMRARSGQEARLFNGRDGEWRAALQVERRSVRATPTALLRPQRPEPGPVLAFAPIKRQRLELVLEKATELGAATLQPVATLHAVVDRLNHERLTAILREAAEQSERLTLPRLEPLVPLERWLAEREAEVPLYAALERMDAVGLDAALARHGRGDLLIGPEGGFAVAERASVVAARRVVPVTLGPRILRAETAAIVALGALALRRSD